MDEETAAVIQNARDLSTWAAAEVVRLDERAAEAGSGGFPPEQQRADRALVRELLVRLSQDRTFVEYMLERQRVGLVERVWRSLIQRARRARAKRA